MSALNLTSFDAMLKAFYTNKKIESLVYPDNPLLAMMPKNMNTGGKYHVVPMKYGNTVGTSATFATASSNKGASKYEDFLVTRVKYYSLADIDNETILSSKNNSAAFMAAATSEIDSAIQAATRNLGLSMFGNKSGAIGIVSSTSTETITLNQIQDISNFEVGQKLQFADAEVTGGIKSNTADNGTIASINRSLGTVTMTAGDAAAVAWADGDFIFHEDDRNLKMAGLGAWIPTTAPTSGDSFYGVDRSVDVTRMAGLREDYSGAPIEEAIIDLANKISREGGRPDVCFISFDKFADLVKSLGSKVQYINTKVADFGFSGISIIGPKGIIKVIPDQNCPHSKMYILTLSSWELVSLGPCPQLLTQDGLRVLRNASSDSIEVRVGYYGNIVNHAPGFSGVGTF